MKIREETCSLFEQDKQYVLDYLRSRGMKNRKFSKMIRDQPFGLLENATFCIGSEEYEISHFLAKSDIDGYDIRKVNACLNTDTTENVIFAVVIGDDVLCYNTKTKAVFLWLVQTGDSSILSVSDNLTKFLKSLN